MSSLPRHLIRTHVPRSLDKLGMTEAEAISDGVHTHDRTVFARNIPRNDTFWTQGFPNELLY